MRMISILQFLSVPASPGCNSDLIAPGACRTLQLSGLRQCDLESADRFENTSPLPIAHAWDENTCPGARNGFHKQRLV